MGAGPGRNVGKRGVEFDQCPAWWGRTPSAWPGQSYGIGNRTVYEWACEQDFLAERGALGDADTWPGRLRDCIRILHGRRAVRQAAEREHDRRVADIARIRGGR